MLILLIELSRYCPGMVTALGVSVGLTASAIEAEGTTAPAGALGARPADPRARSGAWAHDRTRSRLGRLRRDAVDARRDGDDYMLNGSKTFITNGPYADTIVFICKLDEGNPPDERKVSLRARPRHARSRAVQAAAQDGHALARPPASSS